MTDLRQLRQEPEGIGRKHPTRTHRAEDGSGAVVRGHNDQPLPVPSAELSWWMVGSVFIRYKLETSWTTSFDAS